MDFSVENVKLVGKGNIIARFDLVIAGVGTLWKAGLFKAQDGSKFVNFPSTKRAKSDAAGEPIRVGGVVQFEHIKSGSVDRTINPVLTALVEAEVAKQVAALA